MMRRYSIDIGETLDSLLSELATNQNISRAEIIRRAIAYYAFLYKETEKGNTVSVTDTNGKEKEIVFLP